MANFKKNIQLENTYHLVLIVMQPEIIVYLA